MYGQLKITWLKIVCLIGIFPITTIENQAWFPSTEGEEMTQCLKSCCWMWHDSRYNRVVSDNGVEKLSPWMLCCGSCEAAKIKHLPILTVEASVSSLPVPQESWRNASYRFYFIGFCGLSNILCKRLLVAWKRCPLRKRGPECLDRLDLFQRGGRDVLTHSAVYL